MRGQFTDMWPVLTLVFSCESKNEFSSLSVVQWCMKHHSQTSLSHQSASVVQHSKFTLLTWTWEKSARWTFSPSYETHDDRVDSDWNDWILLTKCDQSQWSLVLSYGFWRVLTCFKLQLESVSHRSRSHFSLTTVTHKCKQVKVNIVCLHRSYLWWVVL